MALSQSSGAVAVGNEEAVRAWDTVLYERWKKNRKVFVGALDVVTEEVFDRYPPPPGGRCIDIGCGFGDTTRDGRARRPRWLRARHRLVPPLRRGRASRGGRGGGRERRVRGGRRADGGVGSGLRLRLLADGDTVLRRAGPGDAGDPGRAQARRRAAQDLLAPQSGEPVLGGDGAGGPALPLASRRVRGGHLRTRAILPRQPGNADAASSKPPGSRRSSCTVATSTTSWEGTWTRPSMPCSRSARAPS